MDDSPEQPGGTVDSSLSSALRSPVSHTIFWSISAGTLFLDLWSKHWIFTALSPTEPRTIIANVVEFRRSLNDGAVFGSFTGYTSVFIVASIFALGFVLYLFAQSRARQYTLHLALGLILAGALGNLYDRAFIRADVVHYRDGGQTVGIIGIIQSEPDAARIRIGAWPDGENVRTVNRSDVDQLDIRRQGVVRDFIRFMPKFPKWVAKLGGRDVWPWVFNVADAALVCGVGVLLLQSLFGKRLPRATPR